MNTSKQPERREVLSGKKLFWKELCVLSFATWIIAAAVFFFLIPSGTSVSSISGLAIVIGHFLPFSISVITMVLNVLLLIIGFLACGKSFGYKTVYTSILLPVFLWIFEQIFPENSSMTGSAALDVVCYTLTVSIGLSILFNRNASSGGLDIVAKIMNLYLHMDLGKAMSLAGMAVALSSALSGDKKTVVLSVVGTYLNGLVLDHFIFDQNLKRRVCIISDGNEEDILRFLVEEIHGNASIYTCTGAGGKGEHKEMITILDRQKYQKLLSFMNKNYPTAFMSVYTVSDLRQAGY